MQKEHVSRKQHMLYKVGLYQSEVGLQLITDSTYRGDITPVTHCNDYL